MYEMQRRAGSVARACVIVSYAFGGLGLLWTLISLLDGFLAFLFSGLSSLTTVSAFLGAATILHAQELRFSVQTSQGPSPTSARTGKTVERWGPPAATVIAITGWLVGLSLLYVGLEGRRFAAAFGQGGAGGLLLLGVIVQAIAIVLLFTAFSTAVRAAAMGVDHDTSGTSPRSAASPGAPSLRPLSSSRLPDRSDHERQIVSFLQQQRTPLSTPEIANRLELGVGVVRESMRRAVQRGDVRFQEPAGWVTTD